jgi:hypothetical protein
MKLKPGVILSAITIYLFSLSACADSLSTELISSIKSELQEILKTDQATRQEIQHALDTHSRGSAEVKALWQKQSQIDENNRKRVSDILEQYGWPELSDFGDLSAARAILLVIQHGDLEYQLQYFDRAEQAAESGNLQPYLFALLKDRVLVRQGKKQIYGSQVRIDNVTGNAYFLPIEDEANVDTRRSAVGLEPIAEYGAHYGISYKKD